MKKIKTLLAILFSILTINSFAVVHVINYFPTGSIVTCDYGDTVRFTNNTGINNVSGILVDTDILPTGTGIPPSGHYDFVVTGTLSVGSHTCTMVVNSNAYSTSTLIVQGTSTGLKSSYDKDIDIKVFPNPVAHTLTVSTKNAVELNITNVVGDVVLTKELKLGNNKIDIQSLSSGIYFVRIHDHTVKILKE